MRLLWSSEGCQNRVESWTRAWLSPHEWRHERILLPCRDDAVFHDDFLNLFPEYWSRVPHDFQFVYVGHIYWGSVWDNETVHGKSEAPTQQAGALRPIQTTSSLYSSALRCINFIASHAEGAGSQAPCGLQRS